MHARLLPRRLLPQTRTFISHQHASPSPYTPTETLLLTSALAHVPTHGFTSTSLALAARENGYLDISINLFPRGAFDLVLFHLHTQRTQLSTRVDFSGAEQAGRKLGMTDRIRTLCQQRLRGNVESGVMPRLKEALTLMSLAENIPASIEELARLSDEIWYAAGDRSADTAWYSKRALVAGVYASTELFMVTDRSDGFADTWGFLDRRLEDVAVAGKTVGDVGEFVGFSLRAAGNVLRSKGVGFF